MNIELEAIDKAIVALCNLQELGLANPTTESAIDELRQMERAIQHDIEQLEPDFS